MRARTGARGSDAPAQGDTVPTPSPSPLRLQTHLVPLTVPAGIRSSIPSYEFSSCSMSDGLESYRSAPDPTSSIQSKTRACL